MVKIKTDWKGNNILAGHIIAIYHTEPYWKLLKEFTVSPSGTVLRGTSKRGTYITITDLMNAQTDDCILCIKGVSDNPKDWVKHIQSINPQKETRWQKIKKFLNGK